MLNYEVSFVYASAAYFIRCLPLVFEVWNVMIRNVYILTSVDPDWPRFYSLSQSVIAKSPWWSNNIWFGHLALFQDYQMFFFLYLHTSVPAFQIRVSWITYGSLLSVRIWLASRHLKRNHIVQNLLAFTNCVGWNWICGAAISEEVICVINVQDVSLFRACVWSHVCYHFYLDSCLWSKSRKTHCSGFNCEYSASTLNPINVPVENHRFS